jgi:hypothetical protein
MQVTLHANLQAISWFIKEGAVLMQLTHVFVVPLCVIARLTTTMLLPKMWALKISDLKRW